MKSFLLLAALCGSLSAAADEYITAGDGTIYDFGRLAAIAESGVQPAGDAAYTLTKDVTIAVGDSFDIEQSVRVGLADGVRLTFKGGARLEATRVVVAPADTSAGSTCAPYGIVVDNSTHATNVSGFVFDRCGLRSMGRCGLNISRCDFCQHNGVSGSAALLMGADGAAFTVRDCHFTGGQRSAIGGAANYLNPVVIERCTFIANGQANRNAPQLNLTVADSVVVRGCVLRGDSSRNMVGGIVVSNLMNFSGDYRTLIEDCHISNHRFGIATYMRQQATLRRNQIVNNCFEANPMNGGSGINIYDPNSQQQAHIEGNRIELNLWGITVIGGQKVNAGRTDVATDDADYNPGQNTFLNNGFDGIVYDFYNNSAATVYAQGNYWLSATEPTADAIEQCVYHQADDAQLGPVIFSPGATDPAGVALLRQTTTTAGESYTLDGRRVQGRCHGLVLKRDGGRTIKLMAR